jgi:hypothetical protein
MAKDVAARGLDKDAARDADIREREAQKNMPPPAKKEEIIKIDVGKKTTAPAAKKQAKFESDDDEFSLNFDDPVESKSSSSHAVEPSERKSISLGTHTQTNTNVADDWEVREAMIDTILKM